MGIKRIETIVDPEQCDETETYIEYEIIHDDGSKGVVDLGIFSFEDSFIGDYVRKENLSSETLVGHIGHFYPHSETSPKLRGIGSQVLDYIIEDVKRREVQLIYAEVINMGSEQFFRKKGFEGNLPTLYFMIV